MRVPLLHADFEHGSFTKIAKALRKIWPLGEQSLMQSQNSLAVVLGYNGLHDAHREATASFSIPDGSLSMQKIASAVAWRMFVRYGIDLLSARTLVSGLHLHELAVAGISLEAKMRRTVEDAAKKGVFYDEWWDHANAREPWPEQTPTLLSKGIPPYKWAIYPDRRVFIWPLLVKQIEMLPEEFADDLRQAGKLRNAPDAVISFMVDSLTPSACRPLTDALACGDLTAAVGAQPQWQLKWIVTRQAELLGCCIVAENLGGMIPRVFEPGGDAAYAALAGLLCGDTVSSASDPAANARVSEPVWLLDRRRLEQLKDDGQSDLLDSRLYHEHWPHTVDLYRGHDGCRLVARAEFSERGQVYLATSMYDASDQWRMLREEPVFETFDVTADLLAQVGSENGIPALGNHWHDAVERMFSGRKSDVEAAMETPAGVERLRTSVTAMTSPADLDAFVERAIDVGLPLRYEGDTDDNDDLVSERRSAVDLVEHLGKAVIASMPSLQAYSSLALGYMVLVAGGEYPGSRYQGMVNAPASTDWTGQSRLLAAMHLYENLSDREVAWKALSCAIGPVLGLGNGEPSKKMIGTWYQSAYAVERRLKEAADQIKQVGDWRAIEAEVQRLRAHGEFLRVGDLIPAARPKSPAEALTELYGMTRSAGFSVTHAKQDLSSMKETFG